jgi:hypothetical protein
MEGVQVMQTKFLVRLATLLLFLGAGWRCEASGEQPKDLEAHLQKAFGLIYLATNGLDYPGSVHTLNKCVKHKDKECLEVYKLVLEGKKMIQSVSSMKSLETTLDIIEKTCLSEDQKLANSVCDGGILSLYFYTLPEQDAKILARVKNYPKKIKNIIFHHRFYWFYNRPNKAAWVSAISEMDIDWRNDSHKQRTLVLFRKNIAELKGETFIAK